MWIGIIVVYFFIGLAITILVSDEDSAPTTLWLWPIVLALIVIIEFPKWLSRLRRK